MLLNNRNLITTLVQIPGQTQISSHRQQHSEAIEETPFRQIPVQFIDNYWLQGAAG